MGRRSFGFSSTAISRWEAASRARRTSEERDFLISQNLGKAKELPTKYYISTFDFAPTTRITKITFKIVKQYRTIERYVTQNYQRYPIYSCWKTKDTYLDKVLKLTNLALENLNTHEHELVRYFADDIIMRLDDLELIPSWLKKKIIVNDCNESIREQNTLLEKLSANLQQANINNEKSILIKQNEIAELSKYINKLECKIAKLSAKLTKLLNRKKSYAISIFTLGIYNLLNSKKRYKRLSCKKNIFDDDLRERQIKTSHLNCEIQKILKTQEQDKKEYALKASKITETIALFRLKSDEEIQQIRPLSSHYNEDMDFVFLKNLVALEYKKTTGCYIIWNTENNKYYVGQSKDVIKRIRQHFKGTTPNNIVFAEDYFSSQLDNKDDLFKVKIINLETKDQLDETERQLIEEYDSNINGYNSTKGNV